jgi:hypothetical protein
VHGNQWFKKCEKSLKYSSFARRPLPTLSEDSVLISKPFPDFIL